MSKKIMERQPKLPFTELTAISPLDGRYREKITDLVPYVSEFALIRTRFEIEAKYLVALANAGIVRNLTESERRKLETFSRSITLKEAQDVKKTEEETRHDVKAMERSFRKMVKGTSLGDLTEMVHFGLTSEDVNNLSYRLMLKRACSEVCIPTLDLLVDELIDQAEKYQSTPMLARTHGQAAVPTTLGKEIINFASRLNDEVRKLENQKLTGKLTGAVGNFNALVAAYPNIDWISFSTRFVESLGLRPNLVTTQINPYEDMIELMQNIQRINGVIMDFDQDMWRYISDDWFAQVVKKGEVGSSTMPQKVNPIDFENSEGNLQLANGIIESMARKLAISRLQRDLSDSTTIRNVGVILGHCLVGYKSSLTGLSRVRPNFDRISDDLNRDWSILAESAQTILRCAQVEDPYSLVSSLTKGRRFDRNEWQSWIRSLPVDVEIKRKLERLTPENYIGLAVELTRGKIEEIRSTRSKE